MMEAKWQSTVNHVQNMHEHSMLEPGTAYLVQYVAENDSWSNFQWYWLVLALFWLQCTPAITYCGGECPRLCQVVSL